MKPTKSVLNGKNINLTGDNTIITSNNFNVDKDGNMSCKNANVSGTITSDNASIKGRVEATSGKIGEISITNDGYLTTKKNDGAYFSLMKDGLNFGKRSGTSQWSLAYIGISETNSNINFLRSDDNPSQLAVQTVVASNYENLSKESLKENFELYQNALNVIKNSEIYKYNYKNKPEKKIGFVIPDLGGDFKTPNEVITNDKQGIDIYVMASIMWKAIQELNTQVEELQKEIRELKKKEEK